MPHQAAGAQWLLDSPRRLLADEVGLGKTVTVFGGISSLLVSGTVSLDTPVIWVTEASLVRQTERKIERFLSDVLVATSADKRWQPSPSKRTLSAYSERFPQGAHVYVVSYDFVTRQPDVVRGLLPTGQLPLLVLDEVTAVKQGETGKTWQAIHGLSTLADRTWGLTATPVENDPTEGYAILAALGTPGLWAKGDFEERFVEWTEGRWQQGQWVAPKPLGFQPRMDVPFRQYLSQFMLLRTAEQAGVSKPALVGERIRWVPLTAQQEAEYARVEGVSGLRGHQERERIGRKSKSGNSNLLDACMRELASRPSDQKCVIYAETLDILQMLCERLREAQIGYVKIEGATSKDGRADAIERHRDHPGVRVLAGSRVLEYGLDLQHCNVLFSLDTSWNPAREKQREGRICRIGSPFATYEHLSFVADTPQARRKAGVLGRKSFVATQATGV